jgi:hypothetical protein
MQFYNVKKIYKFWLLSEETIQHRITFHSSYSQKVT